MLGNALAYIYAVFDDLKRTPARRAMQQTVFWGVLILAGLLVVLSSWYQGRIADKVAAAVSEALEREPWAAPLVQLNGRDVSLVGSVEPGRNVDKIVHLLGNVSGVRAVTSEVERKPLPSAEFSLSLSEMKVSLGGKLNGNDLDQVVLAVKRSFPSLGIRDRIRIDDRLGQPFWIDAVDQTMDALRGLQQFNLYGWRDVLMLTGVAGTASQKRQLRYALAARLGPEVKLDYQVRVQEPDGAISLSLLSGWNGASLSGRIPDRKTGRNLLRGLVAMSDQRDDVTSNLTYDTSLSSPVLARQAARLLPALSRVHDMRLETSGEGLALWGRVDTGEQLGEIIAAIERAGLNVLIENRIFIDPARRLPEISLFRDSSRAIVNGRMPGIRARADLLSRFERELGVTQLESFVNVEPNIAYSDWLDKWSILIPVMPESSFGLTVAGSAVMVSGQTRNKSAKSALLAAIGSMFPDMRIVDWLTVAE